MHYHTLGKIPHKRHTQFRKENGELFAEELVSTEGFASNYSLVYHYHPPTLVKKAGDGVDIRPKSAISNNMKHRAFNGFKIAEKKDFIKSRNTVLFNNDVEITLAAPQQSTEDYFYKNASADEMIFIHKGSGRLDTVFGSIKFEYGDYLVIPRGTIYQLKFDDSDNRLLIVESFSPIQTPKRYRNNFGQLLEHSPFCERDIRKPKNLKSIDEKGEFNVKIKKNGYLYDYVYATHPFDAVGWDGYLYPYAFSIHDFEPITGRVHQPPPVHQTFEAHNFVICSFVPRLFDYHPEAIPAPYNHSNVDSDEVLYYVDGDFMSRKHVEKGMITLHPLGIPHGPHPGTVEKSIGAKETHELAVMIDTFKPLFLSQSALDIEDTEYHLSWNE